MMNVVYLDTNPDDAEYFKQQCELCPEIESVNIFDNAKDFNAYIEKENVDVVFCERNVNDIDALELVKRLWHSPYGIPTVLVTADNTLGELCYECGMYSYLVKPVNEGKIQHVLDRVVHFDMLYEAGGKKDVYIKTFGRFEVFVKNKAVHFSNKKAKELLALLVDREGGFVTMEQVIDNLWEDRAYDECTKTLYRTALKNLRDTLTKLGCNDILIEKRGQRCINKKLVSCDYYDFLMNPQKHSHLFGDEYIIDYPWSEFTLAKIVKINEKIKKNHKI